MTRTWTPRCGLVGWLVLSVAACGGDTGTGTQPVAQPSGTSGTAASSSTAGTPAGGTSSPSGAAGKLAPAAGSGTPSAPTGGTAAKPAGAAGMSAAAAGGGAGMSAAAGASAGASATAGASAGAMGTAGMAAASGDCDRACLLGVMQKYLDAVIAHDPTKAPISPSVKMTDNGMSAKPGDGLWKTATALDKDKRLDFADPTWKNVATHVVVTEGSSNAMYLVRLKVESQQITEIETMTVRQANAANGFYTIANLKPEPVFLQMPQKPMTRDAMIMVQELYLDYLEGKKNGMQVPFDPMCKRYENGVATASGLSSFNAQSWGFQVTRRILVVDEEAGITFGMFPFMQSAMPLVVGEAFKMIDGKIMMIQAIMCYMAVGDWPKDLPTGM